MLTAFHARSIRELGSKDRSRQECILAYADKLLVGLNNGTLRIYRVSNPAAPTDPIDIECLREVEGFTKRPIVQMGCIKESSIVVVLADGCISTYDMSTYDKLESLAKTRGATLFALASGVENDISGIPAVVSRLAVVVKRKLLLYLWKDSEFHDSNEINLPSQPRTLTWAAEGKLCAGLSNSFAMIDVNTEHVEDIPMTSGGVAGGYLSWSTRSPLATRLNEDELLLVRDTSSLYISSKGKPITTKQLNWNHAPDQIGYSYPYIVSLHPHNTLQIRNPETQRLLQSISLPGANLLHTPLYNHTLSHAGKQFYLASPTQIWKMILVDYATQVDELTAKGEYDEAISLLSQLELALFEEKDEKIKELQMLKAERLFSKGKYQDSMDIFTQVAAPPTRVIKLFPSIVAGDLSGQVAPEEPTAEAEGKDANAGENGTPEEEPAKRENGENEGKSTPLEESPPTPLRENGEQPITPDSASAPKTGYFGIPVRFKLGGGDDVSSIRSGRSGHRDGDNKRSPSPSPAPGQTTTQASTARARKKLEGDTLKRAVQGLISYLVNMRTKLLKYVKPDVDLDKLEEQVQTPEKAALLNGDPTKSTPTIDLSGAAALLPRPEPGKELSNREQLETLLEMAKVVDTALMRSYMLTNPRLVGSLVRLDNFCDPEVMHEKLIETGRFKELVDYLAKKKLHKKGLVLLKSFGDRNEPDEREPDLHGPKATVEYLQRLHADQLPLIFEYSTWVLHKDPKLGMQIFVDDTPQAESLPRHLVLDFLKSVDVTLTVQYVEHLIHELKDDSPEYHNWLIEGYLIMMREKKEQAGDDGWTWKLNKEERAEYAKKLLQFTEDSQQYWPEKVIKLLPVDDPTFYEIRASILSRLGEHRQALEIFVFKMQDFIKAEAYCNRVHQVSPPSSDPAETSTETVYSILLSLYLSPPTGNKPQIEPALSLLSRHGARVDPLETLKLIPEAIKVADLEAYFENRIRHSNTRVNTNRVMAQLYKAEAFRWEELSADAKKRAVVVGEERVCPVCHKRLGKSVISVFPDGQVVHYGCASRLAGEKGMEVKEEPELGLRRGFGADRWGSTSGSTGGWR